jgi:hypothetical protein
MSKMTTNTIQMSKKVKKVKIYEIITLNNNVDVRYDYQQNKNCVKITSTATE